MITPYASNRLRVEELAEEALVSWLHSHPDLAAIETTSLQDNELVDINQRIIVRAESMGEFAPGLGVQKLRCRVTLEADATQVTEDNFKLWWAAILGYVMWDELIDELRLRVPSLGIYDRGILHNQAPSSKSSSEDRWVQSTSLDIMGYEKP